MLKFILGEDILLLVVMKNVRLFFNKLDRFYLGLNLVLKGN